MCGMCPQPAIFGRADVLVDSSACAECRGYMRVAGGQPFGEARDDAEYHELCRWLWGEIGIASGEARMVWIVCPCCGPSSVIDIAAGITVAKQTAGDRHGEPAQVPAPSSDVTRDGWGDSTSMDVASARVPNTRAVVE